MIGPLFRFNRAAPTPHRLCGGECITVPRRRPHHEEFLGMVEEQRLRYEDFPKPARNSARFS
jgi:hypothetical protein